MNVSLAWTTDGSAFQVDVELPGLPAVGDHVSAGGVSGRVKSRWWDENGVDLDLEDVEVDAEEETA